MHREYIDLPDRQVDFIRKGVEEGRYASASEVVRAGLRLLEQTEAEDTLRLMALKRIANESFDALDRGEYTSYTSESIHELFESIALRQASEPSER